jgi:hypothetical protein
MFACCYFDIFFQELHDDDDDVKIDGGNLVRQPHTLPGRSGTTCQEQDSFEWGAAFRSTRYGAPMRLVRFENLRQG